MSVINQIKLGTTSYNIANSAMGTCTTAGSTAAKVVTLDGFTLQDGVTIYVRFQYANTASSPTLNVGTTGAKAIVQDYLATMMDKSGSFAITSWDAGAVCAFTYYASTGVWVLVSCSNYQGCQLTNKIYATSSGGYGHFMYFTGDSTYNTGVIIQHNNAYLKLNKLQLPTFSGSSTYGAGSNGDILTSNGSTVYWDSFEEKLNYSINSSGIKLLATTSTGLTNATATNPYLTLMGTDDSYGSSTGAVQLIGAGNVHVESNSGGAVTINWKPDSSVLYSDGFLLTHCYENGTAATTRIKAENNVIYPWSLYFDNGGDITDDPSVCAPLYNDTVDAYLGTSTHPWNYIYGSAIYKGGVELSNLYLQSSTYSSSTNRINIVETLTSSQYSNLSSKDANTLYVIVS